MSRETDIIILDALITLLDNVHTKSAFHNDPLDAVRITVANHANKLKAGEINNDEPANVNSADHRLGRRRLRSGGQMGYEE